MLCHRVLEFVESPSDMLAAATGTLAPGGILSVVAANRPGVVLSRIISGRFDEANAVLDRTSPAVRARVLAELPPSVREKLDALELRV